MRLTFLLLLSSSTVVADIEETIVYGELRENSALDIANSVSVINDNTLHVRNAQNLEDVLNLAPNVNFSTGASRGRFIQIRGIGERSEFISPLNASVGVLVDGIDFTGIATGVTTLDTQQIEVFRGPQGTLHGANALAGLINVISNPVASNHEGEIEVGLGNFNSREVSGFYNRPINESTGLRYAFSQIESDGFIENTYLDREDTNNIDERSAKITLSHKTQNLTLDWINYFIDVDNGYDAFSLNHNRTTLSDEPGHDRQETLANAIDLTYTGWNGGTWQSIISRADSDLEYGYDEDWAFRTICAIDDDCAFFQYSANDNYVRQNTNVAIDTRVISTIDNGKIAYVLGFYSRNQQVDLSRTRTDNDPNFDTFYGPIIDQEIFEYESQFDTKNTALYGQLDYSATENTKLSLGVRVENRDATLTVNGTQLDNKSEDLWGGNLSIEHTLSSGNLVYGLVSRGYKAGGFNPELAGIDFSELPIAEEAVTFDTEFLVNYEIGLKGAWLDNRLQSQIALFFQDREDVQANQSLAVSVDNFIGYTGNAASGSNYGLELDSTFQITQPLHTFLSLGLLETGYDNYLNPVHVDATAEQPYDLSDRDQAHAPNYQFVVGGHYELLSDQFVRVEFEGKDSFFFSESHNERSDNYVLLNLRYGINKEDWSFAVWGKNLTDEEVQTRGFYFSNDFGNDPREFYAPETYTQLGAPRTFGINGTYRF